MTKVGSFAGKTIDRYEFLELIGSGTFGEVYRAYDTKLLRNVAIKVNTFSHTGKDIHQQTIIREARIHARAEHANIVPIYDVLEQRQSVFIVMRLVNGEDLEHMMSRLKEPLGIDDALKIMRQVFWGMEYAHSKGIVHLDLKPGNLRLTLSSEVLIMDFGVATLLEEQSLLEGQLHGTPAYMSPEQIKCSYMDARSDIYSIGIILYRMITGHHPFEDAKTVEALLESHISKKPVKPSHYLSSLPEDLEKVLLKALEKNSRNRYHSCREFALALELAAGLNGHTDTLYTELRWDPRVSVYLNARIKINEDSDFISAVVMNLSVGGASLRVSSDIAIGSNFLLELYLPGDAVYIKVRVRATVLWKDNDPEKENIDIGVSLDNLEDIDRYHISLFVRDHLLNGEMEDLPAEVTIPFL